MKNMKRLISIIAVVAMMLSMATVAFAAAIGAGETFNIAVSDTTIEEGSTDTFDVVLTMTVESATSAANGVSNLCLELYFDETKIINVGDKTTWSVSEDLDSTKLLHKTTAALNGSQGALMVGYQTVILDDTITTGSQIIIPFRLVDGAEPGDVEITVGGNTAIISKNASGGNNSNWITKANIANYVTPGTVTIESATPPAPVDPVVTPDTGEAGEAGTTVVWGTAANVTPVANGKDGEGNDIYTYTSEAGAPVEFGVQITDGEFAGFYPALGLKEGKFAIKFIGDAAGDLLTQLYLKVDGVLQD